MNAAEALAHLSGISSQIQVAVVFDDEGTVIGSTLEDDDRSQRIARAASDLLRAAAELEHQPEKRIVQLEAALGSGSVFVVRDAGHTIAATTGRQPTAGLVFFDLKSCLRDIAGETRSSTAGARSDAGA